MNNPIFTEEHDMLREQLRRFIDKEVKPHGDHVLSDEDTAAIADWMAARQTLLAGRDMDDITRTSEHLNLTTHWANSRASDEQLEAITDDLLLAMHDLRTVLVRKKAGRLNRA